MLSNFSVSSGGFSSMSSFLAASSEFSDVDASTFSSGCSSIVSSVSTCKSSTCPGRSDGSVGAFESLDPGLGEPCYVLIFLFRRNISES